MYIGMLLGGCEMVKEIEKSICAIMSGSVTPTNLNFLDPLNKCCRPPSLLVWAQIHDHNL